jgi:glucoamylase
VVDTPPVDTGLGFYAAALDTTGLPAGAAIDFTWRGQDGEWAGRNWRVEVTAAPQPAASSTTLQAAPRVAK